MKILKLILENFNNISTAMSARKVSIDFTQAKNPICLLIGPNGSGKTTILSLLHPFASLGNLDVRDGEGLIVSGEEGYKEIHIESASDVYVMKHFYTPNSRGTHNVKSYITKNGTELNPNGNVTSFKEFVKEELDVELDFLKLIRLGDNVTSLIKLSETERKNFMSKLLDDVGIYLQFYKKVNMDLRELKEIMSHDDDKLKRLGIENYDDAKKELKKLKKDLDDEEVHERSVRDKLSILTHELSKVESIADIRSEIREYKRKIANMESAIEKFHNRHDIPDTFQDDIPKLEKDKMKLESSIEKSESLTKEYINMLDGLYDQKHTKSVHLQQEQESGKETQKMNEIINELRSNIEKTSNILDGFEAQCSLTDLENLIVFLKTINDTITRCYDFGMRPVKQVISLMRDKKNVQNYINSHIAKLTDVDNDTNALLTSLVRGVNIDKDHLCGTDNSCPAFAVYKKVRSMVNFRDDENKSENQEFYTYMDLIYKIIIGSLPQFKDYQNIIMTLPQKMQDMFTDEVIFKCIEEGKDIYDKKLFNDYLSLVTEYDHMIKSKQKLEDMEKGLSQIGGKSNISYLIDELEDINNSIETYKSKVNKESNSISENRNKIAEISRTLEEYYELKDAFDNHEQALKDLEILQKKEAFYDENYQQRIKVEGILKEVEESVRSYRIQIQRLSNSLDQYVALKNELNTFNDTFDEMTLIKQSLSSKNGIPLYYIDMYLGNTEELTNELLDIAYDGRIYIDKFQLTATEFGIPYFNNGKRIRDVKLASSGELAFLSLALSFALASQAISKYNIMLLDEVDATLDQRNREKFIQILERQIEIIDSEQNFLITHNNMFSSYPLDILDFSFGGKDASGVSMREQYPLANFIEIIRE